MARPKKQTVDYFPHCCNHKKTMFVLEQRYGNDGYAFWFKLLEMLGSAEGHALDINDLAAWEFLQAKTKLSDSFCIEILELLVKLGAIDSELWGKKVIWCQNFVDGIADVYKNRRVSVPEKPSISSFYEQESHCAGISTTINPQSKVKETKVKKTKKDTPPLPEENPPAIKYAEFVSMTADEHEKLLATYGVTDVARMISKLDSYKGSSGKKYKSDYHAILSWVAKEILNDKREAQASRQKTSLGILQELYDEEVAKSGQNGDDQVVCAAQDCIPPLLREPE